MPEPNAYVVESGSARILLDCGAYKSGNHPDFGTVDACLLSHAHWDHCGGLITLIEAGIPCYSTPKTAAFISSAFKPSIGESRSRAIQDTVTVRRFHDPFEIGDLSCVFLPSGHVPGGSMIQITDSSGKTLLYTSDFMTQPLLSCEPIVDVDPPDLLVCETALCNLRVIENDLEVARRAFTDHQSVIVGRAIGDLTEVAAVLTTHGLEFVAHHNTGFGDADQQTTLLAAQAGKIVLVAGDLTEGSASFQLVRPLLQNPESRIILLNGAAKSKIGGLLCGTQRRSKVLVAGQKIRLRARVQSVSLRQHVSREELLDWLVLTGARRAVCVHGPDAGQHIVARLALKLGVCLDVGEVGERYEID